MLVHGLRRAAEMEEVVKTLDGLGTGAAMTRGTVARQRAIGALGVKMVPEGLGAKIGVVSSKVIPAQSEMHLATSRQEELLGDGFPPSRE